MTIVYTLVMALVGVLEFKRGSRLNVPVLFGIAYWCFYSYSNKNSRVIVGREKWKLVFYAIAADVLASILLEVPTLLANEVPSKFLSIWYGSGHSIASIGINCSKF
ncbi:MAG: ABZJ_00895 family protein [Paraglaciecola sp.]|uniref:ABZJ_00895 family protein n=1 Tax=Paraglaciecola sp. TaxID=1920173 RepID=UPI00329732E4